MNTGPYNKHAQQGLRAPLGDSAPQMDRDFTSRKLERAVSMTASPLAGRLPEGVVGPL
jgi:hypothetical protein